jgi:predicted PurR-regulated permease PerM
MPSSATAEAGRVARTIRLMFIATVLLVIAWAAAPVLLLVFAGVLFGIALHGLAGILTRHTGLPRALALILVILGLVALFGVIGLLAAPQIAEQFDQLWEQVTQELGNLQRLFDRYASDGALQDGNGMGETAGQVVSTVAGAAYWSMTALGAVLIVFFIGIYIAANPDLYRDGVLRLVPIPHRPRARQMLDRLGFVLRWWLLGQLVSMITIGILTGLGLWLLGIQLWLALAFLAAVLTFVPYLGPIIAAIPAILVAIGDGAMTALYVAALYLVVQSLEGYLITPMVQQQAVRLPPALTISAQVFMGVLFGLPGILLATPLAAAGMELTRMVYVRDVLEDREAEPG